MTDRSPRGGISPLPSWPIITLERVNHSVGADGVIWISTVAAASGASPFDAANEMLAFPFVLWQTTPMNKVWVYNGSSPGDNFSIGLYDADFKLLAETASTGGSGASDAQTVTLQRKLSAGLYYLALAADNATTNRYFRWTVATLGASYWKMFGCWKQASITLGALPNPATPVACTNIAFPYFGLITRTVFDL